MQRYAQRLMTLVRIVYTVLSVPLIIAVLWGRDDPATNLVISLTALLIIALVSFWYWLRDRRDRHP